LKLNRPKMPLLVVPLFGGVLLTIAAVEEATSVMKNVLDTPEPVYHCFYSY
jgi:hypothetical protein